MLAFTLFPRRRQHQTLGASNAHQRPNFTVPVRAFILRGAFLFFGECGERGKRWPPREPLSHPM
jgi:hypothetical protein